MKTIIIEFLVYVAISGIVILSTIFFDVELTKMTLMVLGFLWIAIQSDKITKWLMSK